MKLLTKQRFIIGTRQSILALWQSNFIAERLRERYPDCDVELKKIVTKGDKVLDVPLAKIGGKGLFTKEIEQELLDGSIDLAVHSLKDMPTVLPGDLCLTAITKRAKVGDAFVSNKYKSFSTLPSGAIVGTSSLRRKAQLLAARPDLDIRDLRGNVDTRLRKLDDGMYDAIVLAVSGLERLGHADRVAQYLPHELCMPAVGQGALAIECREDRAELRRQLDFLNDRPTLVCTTAERAYLGLLEGGCQVPIGVHATLGGVGGSRIRIDAIIASLDGKTVLHDTIGGSSEEAAKLGRQLGERMLLHGGREILDSILKER